MTILKDLILHFDQIWPPAQAEDWDRPGLMLGDVQSDVLKVLVSVDCTEKVISEAIEIGADLLVSHHPLYLRGFTSLTEQSFKGRLSAKAIRANLAIFAAHTNADFQTDGVGESLAKAIGLEKLEPLDPLTKHGTIGTLPEPLSLLQLSRLLAKRLPAVAAGIKVSGDPNRVIGRVGLLAGAGDSYLNTALEAGIDVFITSDLRHHPAQDFISQSNVSNGPALIDIAHFSAEWLWVDVAAASLRAKFPAVEFVGSELNTDPWDFAVMQ
ncbi:Nif3-like dinuclear metal center hexameric protein [Candidatus Aquiluna sp. UB-MaderosW2red]|uniref:Nif3-like dinuclear metal center hexameric protein n=1 Tax=Candidatus Aquiluna sp. UB-MaderosW2red TaxID=1855377 RepID=UPI000875B174|nr:Nif3-like dinuclear metal center hexameric protein [Candidatus Aquiluna sp. UB-MaderosW2red]SCX10948.1 dinuclear metal center protein, YbgI/SA1388 family [Candidatus Aquiluna sp. UB-MaderosW2red]